MSVCPKGIETFDIVTGETLHQIAINKISYCSADATHSNVFAFIAGDNNIEQKSNIDSDELTCYAYLCSKRKVAHNLTITLAKNFERAFDLWKKAEQRKQIRFNESKVLTSTQFTSENSDAWNSNDNSKQIDSNDAFRNVLIDFSPDSMKNNSETLIERQRQMFQTTWVSFEDEPQMCDRNIPDIIENNLWGTNNNDNSLIC